MTKHSDEQSLSGAKSQDVNGISLEQAWKNTFEGWNRDCKAPRPNLKANPMKADDLNHTKERWKQVAGESEGLGTNPFDLPTEDLLDTDKS